MSPYEHMKDDMLLKLARSVKDVQKLSEIKQAGILHGNPDIVYAASEFLGRPITKPEKIKTLMFALGKYGWSIDNPNTVVGRLYQDIFGTDYATKIYVVDSKNDISRSYFELSPATKMAVNKEFCHAHELMPMN